MELVIENVERVTTERMGEIMGLVDTMLTTDRPVKNEEYNWSGEHGEYTVSVCADEYGVDMILVVIK